MIFELFKQLRMVVRSGLIIILFVSPFFVNAQPGGNRSQESGSASEISPMIEEIIVTARRREESLQETPISVTALSGTDLTDRMANNLSDVGNFVPNLDFSIGTQSSRSSIASSVFIRGIGQSDFIITTDPGVGIYIDGVYHARTTGGVLDLLDIERVEVLRGPQGTLFGKNTIGGALNVVSAKPNDELHGTGELTFGRFDRINFRGDVNVPISEDLYGRFSVSAKHSDGFGRRLDFASGAETDETGEDDKLSSRARFRWVATESLEANLSIDYSRTREPQLPNDIVAVNPAGGLLALWNGLIGFPSGTPYTQAFLTNSRDDNFATGPSRAELDLWGVNLTLDWDLGPYRLKSITAYRDMQALFSNDGDGSPLRVLGSDLVDLDQDQISQEIHLSGSSFDERLDWLVGFYYFGESAFEITNAYVLPGLFQVLEALPAPVVPLGPYACPQPAGSPLPCLGGAGNPLNIPLDLDFGGTNNVEITNYSVFAHGTYALTDRLSLTAGARVIHEEKTHNIVYQRVNSGFFIAPPGTMEEESWTEVTPKAGIEFKPNDDILLYLSASRGFRSGGFNGRPFFPEVIETFDPEFVLSYEAGLKSSWFDRRLVLNASAFFNDYTDVQLTLNRATADGNVGVFTENGGEAEMKGFELELHARPFEGFDLMAGIGYIDAEFTEVDPTASITAAQEFQKTPEWDLNLSAQYTMPVNPFGRVSLRGDYSYRSEYFNDSINSVHLRQDGVGLINARIAFEDNSETWQLAVFGTNLTDERYIYAGIGGFAAIGFVEALYSRPREWGVSLTYRF